MFSQAVVWQSKYSILSHTVNPASVFWQAVLCKQRCFLEQLSCRIFIVWLRFQWENYDISRQHRSSSARWGVGGVSHFPLRAALSERDQRTDLSRKSTWSVDGSFVFGWFSLKLNSLKKKSLDWKKLLKAILIFLVRSSWHFVHYNSFIVRVLLFSFTGNLISRLGSDWWSIHWLKGLIL